MTKRIAQINGLLRKELSGILLKGEGLDRQTLMTITRVETTQDLVEAKVYISIFPNEKSVEVMDFLKKNIYHIQQELNKRLCIRRVPKIVFYREIKTEEAGKIEKLIGEIHKDDN
ncbi:30S ribosome-binding factor RbfA [Patescibacteria group bacterium]|nr:30S ribosome-binding factor RbfA [Patescibacteria group bacterium]